MEKLLPEGILNMESIDGGKAFSESVWLAGFTADPPMTFIGFHPNQAAYIRLLARGKLSMLLIHSEQLAAATEKLGPRMESLDYMDDMAKWKEGDIKKFMDAKVPIYGCTQQAGEALYVPQGWLAVEWVPAGESDVYGIRKSVLHCSGHKSLACYKQTLKLMKASSKASERSSGVLSSSRCHYLTPHPGPHSPEKP